MKVSDILKNGLDEVGPAYHKGKPSKKDEVYLSVDSALLQRDTAGDVITVSPASLPGVKQPKTK